MCVTSARSITESVNPPRAVFVDFPLGHTTGKPHDPQLQRDIVTQALSALVTVEEPGTIIDLPYRWSKDDLWKRPVDPSQETDARAPRDSTPQYQDEEDRLLAEAIHAAGSCHCCIGIDSE